MLVAPSLKCTEQALRRDGSIRVCSFSDLTVTVDNSHESRIEHEHGTSYDSQYSGKMIIT